MIAFFICIMPWATAFWLLCAEEGHGVNCKCNHDATIMYGVGHNYVSSSARHNNIRECSNRSFGSDPKHRTKKYCMCNYGGDYKVHECAKEGGKCRLQRTGGRLFYGARDKWSYRTIRSSDSKEFECSNNYFRSRLPRKFQAYYVDPIHGVKKSCVYVQRR